MGIRTWFYRPLGAPMAALLLGTFLLAPGPSWAETECAAPAGADPLLGRQEVAARLQFIRQSLQDTAQRERRFALGWSLSYLGMAAGTWALLPFSADPQGQRVASAWNSATSLAGALLLIIDPVRAVRAQRRLESGLAKSGQPDCAALKKAELVLTKAAASQSSARGPRAHILGFFTTVGLGLVLGYGLQRPESAAINTTIGVFLGELMIATRPTSAIQSLARYRSGHLDAVAPAARPLVLGVAPLQIGSGYGIAVSSAF